MAHAKIELPNGTLISVNGDVDEIKSILKYVESGSNVSPENSTQKIVTKKKKIKRTKADNRSSNIQNNRFDIVNKIVSSIHESEDYQKIESNIIDKKDRVAKILLCFKFADDLSETLSTKDIEMITDQLRIKIADSNVAKVIREKAKKYLTGDNVRKQGQKVNYKINRAGLLEYQKIIDNDNNY